MTSPPPTASETVVDLDTVRPLAHRLKVRIGNIVLQPSLRRIDGPLGSKVVEPRTMRVVLALADADGRVLSRDDLIRTCWDGVIVGEDAVQRSIALARRAIAAIGGQLTIGTVARVGYRLVFEGRCSEAATIDDGTRNPNSFTRRQLAVSGIAAFGVMAGVGALGVWRHGPTKRNAHVDALILRGEQSLRDGLPDSELQGAGFFRQAIALDQNNARAWGLLALASRNAVENASPANSAASVRYAELAIKRALILDPENADALLARATLMPDFGDWAKAEDRIREVLIVAPEHSWSLSALGNLLGSVGRDRASLESTKKASELEPLSPVLQYRLAYKLWIADRIGEADQVIDGALQLWPRHQSVVMARFLLFVWTGRYDAARVMLNGEETRESFMAPAFADMWRRSIVGLESRNPSAVRSLRTEQINFAAKSPGAAVLAIQLLSLLGQLSAAFSVASGYLERTGPTIGTLRVPPGQLPIGDQRWRKTVMLFVPATAAMREDRRFESLTRHIQLTDYWLQRRLRPDYLTR